MRTLTESLVVLRRYADADIARTGCRAREGSGRTDLEESMNACGRAIFGQDDPVHDNVKRNLAVQVFLEFESETIFAFGRAWLEKWRQNEHEAWFQEWRVIVERQDSTELADILLSSDEERIRQRLSMPFVGMLDFDAVLRTKRRFRCEEERGG